MLMLKYSEMFEVFMKKSSIFLTQIKKLGLAFMFLFAFCALAIFLPSVRNVYAAFDGSTVPITPVGEGEFHLISSEGQLAFLAEKINQAPEEWANKNFRLTKSLNLNYQNIGVIGNRPETAFSGIFDGDGFTISSIRIFNNTAGNASGLFGFVNGGEIRNLNLFDVNAELLADNAETVGGLAGQMTGGIIQNCEIASARLTGYDAVGGLVGVAEASSVTDSRVFSSYIQAQIHAAGIAAVVEKPADAKTYFTNCESSNSTILAGTFTLVAGIDSSAAGMVARSMGAEMDHCRSIDNSIFSQRYTAGLVARAYNTTIRNSYNSSTVKGNDGINFEGTKAPSGTDVTIIGIDGMDGVNGRAGNMGAHGGTGGSAGGLVCLMDYESTIENSFNGGNVTAGKGGKGGEGGDGGQGGDAYPGSSNNGGKGGNGGRGGNGGAGGNAGGVLVYYINSKSTPVEVDALISNTFSRPGAVSLGNEEGNNGGDAGKGGIGGLAGKNGAGVQESSRNGTNELDGSAGKNGAITMVAGEETRPQITFYYQNESNTVRTVDADYNVALGVVLERENIAPSRGNSRFVGWNTQADGNGEWVNETTPLLEFGGASYFAQYEGTGVVIVHANGGVLSEAATQQFLPGLPAEAALNSVFRPLELTNRKITRNGWAFDGWYLDAATTQKLDPASTVGNLGGATVFAKWLPEIMITFNTAAGIPNVTNNIGGTLTYSEPASILNNFNARQGSDGMVVRVSGRPLGALPSAVPNTVPGGPDYYFGGWYEDILNTKETLVSASTVFTGAKTLTARWNTNAYMEYNLMGATGIDEISPAWTGNATAYGGRGAANRGTTPENAFTIADASQLRQMAIDINATTNNAVNTAARSGHFILTNNIDLNNLAWEPIGMIVNSGTAHRAFRGFFDGNGFYIKGLNVSATFTSNTANNIYGNANTVNLNTQGANSLKFAMGLFGITYGAKISRVGLETGAVRFAMSGVTNISSIYRVYVGSIVGISAGATIMDQCYNNASVTVSVIPTAGQGDTGDLEAYVGGLIGRLDDGTYEFGSAVAGGSTFSDSYNSGNVTSYFDYRNNKVYNFVGGIIGYVFNSKFSNVFNTGAVDVLTKKSQGSGSTIAFAGGICGEINGGGSLINSFNTGNVMSRAIATGDDRRAEVGGIVAHLNNAVPNPTTLAANARPITVNGCKNYGELSIGVQGTTNAPGGGTDIGGIIGLIVGGTTHSTPNSPSFNVSGSKNWYRAGVMFTVNAQTGARTAARADKGIDSYANASARTSFASNDASGTNGPGPNNGNHVKVGVIDLMAHSSTNSYGQGTFEFTNINFFRNSTYFADTNDRTDNNKLWDFLNIWEFRLDRNDNLPLLKYMSYETTYSGGQVFPNRKYVYENERIGRLITPVKTGYLFMGWWDQPVQFDPAIGGLGFDGKRIEVSFGAGNSFTVLNANGFNRFNGKTPTALADDSDYFTGRDNVQIYAGWWPLVNGLPLGWENITLHNLQAGDTNGANPAESSILAFRGYALLSLYTPARTGYEFLGWFTGDNGTGTRMYDSVIYSGQVTELFAHWRAKTYDLVLDPNGGVVTRSTYQATFGALVGNMPYPYRQGYEFLGWNTQADGLGDTIDSSLPWTWDLSGSLKLTAQWQLHIYTITFDKNAPLGGCTPMPEQHFDFDQNQNQTLLKNTYVLEGNSFLGWALTPDGSVIYTDEALYTLNAESNLTLYARWTAISYFVKFHFSGGFLNGAPGQVLEGAAGSMLELPTPINPGFELEYWYVVDNSGVPTGVTFDPTVRFISVPQGGMELRCEWIIPATPYTVILDKHDVDSGNGTTAATGTFSDKELRGNGSVTLTEEYSRTGYNFLGWSVSAESAKAGIPGSVDFTTGDSLTMAALVSAAQMRNITLGTTITLYAVWEAQKTTTVTFNPNADSMGKTGTDVNGSMAAQDYYFDRATGLRANAYGMTGFKFMGWTTSAFSASPWSEIPADSRWTDKAVRQFSSAGSLELFAVWARVEYTITYMADMWTSVFSITVPFEEVIHLPGSTDPRFVRERWLLTGWTYNRFGTIAGGFDLLSGTFSVNAEVLAHATSSNIVLYAVWEAETYTLELYRYEGDPTPVIIMEEVEFGRTVSVDPTSAQRAIFLRDGEGVNFVGFTVGGYLLNVSPSSNWLITIIAECLQGHVSGPLELVAVYEYAQIGLFEGDTTEVVYREATQIQVEANIRSGVTINSVSIVKGNASITPGSIQFNGGVIIFILTATDMGEIEFEVDVSHPSDPSPNHAVETFTLAVVPKTVTVSDWDTDFTYNGSNQTSEVGFAVSGIIPGDENSVSVVLRMKNDPEFKHAGEHEAYFALEGTLAYCYQLDRSLNLVMKQKELRITTNDLFFSYYSNVPLAFDADNNPLLTSFISNYDGFEGEDSAAGLGITINNNTGSRTLLSKVGRYPVVQTISSTQPLGNYSVVFEPCYVEVVPVVLSGVTVNLHSGAGYVEGSWLYFNIEDIDFGAGMEGAFTLSDLDIIWQWSTSPSGVWTTIAGENRNELVLTSRNLNMDVAGLYFHVVIQVKSNAVAEGTSRVDAGDKIVSAASAPFMPMSVIITIGALSAFAIALIAFMIYSSMKTKRILKKLNEQVVKQ